MVGPIADANLRLTRLQVFGLGLLGLGLVTASFVAGWHLSRRPVISRYHGRYLSRKGDAQQQVRAEVLVPLRAFQAGYMKRDASTIPAFMEQLFPKDRDILVLGTDPGEWIEGYQRVGEFIANDWRHWGDLRIEVDDSTISVADDAAWVTTVGTVGFRSSTRRAIRFAAVLTRVNGRWLFRHIQFQWDDGPETLSELLRSIPAGFATE
jgi:hypothetical protein